VDGAKPLDQAVIGVDYTNIRTNLADFSVRAQNITSGPYAGQTTCLRVGGGNDRNKEIHLSISSDMGTASRRWVLRATSETESGGNAGTNFQIARYDDSGVLLEHPAGHLPVHRKRHVDPGPGGQASQFHHEQRVPEHPVPR
jgi:hypothetical protein